MNKVVRLKPKSKALFEVEIEKNNKTEVYVYHQETVFKHNLMKSSRFDDKTLKQIQDDDAFYQAYDLAIRKLANKNHTEKKLRSHLASAHIKPTIINRVLTELKTNHYIDEDNTLKMLINDYENVGLFGRQHLYAKLLKAGFDVEKIQEAFSRLPERIEEEKCQAFVEQQLKTMPQKAVRGMVQRLAVKCYQKGFDKDITNTVLANLEPTLTASIDETALLQEKIARYQKKTDIKDPANRRKLIQKLMREGFSYDRIKKHL